MWKLLEPGYNVRGQCLNFVDRADRDGVSAKAGRYIVALKFLTKEEKALPVPLGMDSIANRIFC